MIWQRTLVASLLAMGAQAGIGDMVAEGMVKGSPSVERRLQEIAKANILSRGYMEIRQVPGLSTGIGSNTPLNADGTIDMDKWNEQVNQACRDSLSTLNVASNPSGACICYNLPVLNNVTGTFEADLRLFQVSAPTGDFQGIPQERINVSLSYNGASVAMKNGVTPGGPEPAEEGNLRLLRSFVFVGQINNDAMGGEEIPMAQLQALVMPIVTLSAANGDGQTVSTNVSVNEAAFVSGVFSQEVVMSTFRMAELAVEEEVARLKNGTTAFVLPGVQLLIFPIGLIITSIWLVVAVAAYGMGTYARYNFRESHRRMVAKTQKGTAPRF
ncbi:hypothetical protein QBC40DRAFT_44170 [Triangularia verruculosa]|uniref:Uncharacterized protein n=1 Tax=Triangularia verruculosa TaxID=2587418 RepID=A0AAN7AXC7_9PEZI|nr:hypothetical protein QBC40DRAFT_44170 [Triangularia verruculosa]